MRATAALIMVTVCLAPVGAGCGGDDAARLSRWGFSFDHPAGWQRVTPDSLPNAEDDPEPFENAVGIDARNWVTVYEDPADASKDAAALARELPEITRQWRQVLAGSDVELAEPPALVRAAGLAGYGLRVAFLADDGTPLQTRLVVLLGSRTITIACQSDAAHEAEIRDGCRGAQDTLRLEDR